MGQCDHIFLAGCWQDGAQGAIVEVPADSLVALFTLQYCRNRNICVVLVTSRVNPATCVFPVALRSLDFRVFVRDEEECPEVLCHCELPAVVSQVKQEEEEEAAHNRLEKRKEEVRKEDQEENRKEEEEEEEDNRLEERKQEVRKEEEEKAKKRTGNINQKYKIDEMETKKQQHESKEEKEEGKNKEEEEEEDDKGGVWREGPWCCAGLCSSLRLAVKQIATAGRAGGRIAEVAAEGTATAEVAAEGTHHHATALLGFRGGCLQACAEVSVWTKFCEVEAPAALLAMAMAPYRGREEVVFPQEVLRYECHLRRPPILHNALKRAQRHIRETVADSTQREEMCRRPLAQLPPLTHQFAEGPDMTLADVMLFACFHLVLGSLVAATVAPKDITPLVTAWHSTMTQNRHIQAALPVLQATEALFTDISRAVAPPRVVVPSVPDISIYKSDPERCKASRGAFTRQGDVEEVLKMVEEARVEPDYMPWPPHTSTSSFFSSSTSEAMPLHTLLPALSLEGHIPESRLQRKMQQVENVCSAVLALTQPDDVVVDFCSGGGHIGIPLAQCLPGCRILLVENKVASLLRARERVQCLHLSNVSFIQTNLDYFRGGFNVGVSLHACGAATDLVLHKCVGQRAAFVVTPCCYGSIRPNHVVSYPRSKAFRGLPLTVDQYLTLGHAADQTHGSDNPKTEQGQRCMRLVDGDRLAEAREAGYLTTLALMHPSSCSPKNHLLLGKPLT